MKKVLIAIVTCHGREHFQTAIRETWLGKVEASGADYRFFFGPSERERLPDEVFLDCDDSYQGLPNKVQEIVRWALAHDYDFVLKCDDDVVLNPMLFMYSGFQNFHFVGHLNNVGTPNIPWGFCYVLSKRAMAIVAVEKLPNNNNDEAWVSDALLSHGIKLTHDKRYYLHYGFPDTIDEPPKDGRRPLRRLQRPLISRAEEGTFATCIHLNWKHHYDHKLLHEASLKEFRRVYLSDCCK